MANKKIIFLLMNILFSILLINIVSAGTLYWVGANNGKWNNASNWASSSGGAGGAGIPDSSTDVVFDSADLDNSTINDSIAVNSINISIGYNGTIISTMNWNYSINVTGNVIISNGNLTHSTNSNAETYRLNMIISGNLTLDGNGTINSNGRGYQNGNGPGRSISQYTGGSYGGMGGMYTANTFASPTYGSIFAPTNIGSPGGYGLSNGGGAIILNVSGETIINGTISSNGVIGSESLTSGSGGSIYLITGNISGSTGKIQAHGGLAGNGGGGGGGRIAIILTSIGANFTNYLGNLTAYGGGPGANRGAAGTIYTETGTQHSVPNSGALTINNNNLSTFGNITTLMPPSTDLTSLSSIVIKNIGKLGIRNDTRINFTNINLSVVNYSLSYITIHNFTNTTFPSNFNISNYTLNIDCPMNITGNWTIANGALSHSDNGAYEFYKINLTIDGNLIIETNGTINVNGKGYYAGYGPGYPSSSTYSGGSFGGTGGTYYSYQEPSLTYGSITSPLNIGSPGNYGNPQGAGAIFLNISGNTIINGTISANGTIGSESLTSGSGGSIYLITGNISGSTGKIQAHGGLAGNGGGGGGGRIAIILTNSNDFGNTNITAHGGGPGNSRGAAGTIYLKTKNQTYGQLIIDNNNYATVTSKTLISENVTDTLVGDLIIRNLGNLNISRYNQSNVIYPNLTIFGNFNRTSNSNFSMNVNSTLILAGNQSQNTTFYSNESFTNLKINKTGGYVFFPANWQTNVNTSFVVYGNASNKTYLRSTIDGTRWKINATTSSVQYADVKDSNNTGPIIYATNSNDSGNNTNWDLNYPNATLNTPQNNTYGNNATQNLTINLTDDAGIKNATLSIYNSSNNPVVGFANDWLEFSGNGLTYVSLGNSSSLNFGNNSFTISVWVKSTQLNLDGNCRGILTKGNWGATDSYNIFNCGTTIYFRSLDDQGNNAYPSMSSLNTNWVNILWVVDRNSNNVIGYLNGVSSTTLVTSFNSSINGGATNLSIGFLGGYAYFNGSIDEVRIYNRSLSASEIVAINNSGRTRNSSINSTGLVTWYDFEEATGTSVIDRATGINNGTIIGASWSGDYITTFSSGALTSTLGVVVSLVDGVYKWFYNMFDWSGNTYTTSNNTLTIDTTYPQINFSSSTPENNSGRSGSFIANISLTELNLANITWNWNGTSYPYNITQISSQANFSNVSNISEGLVAYYSFEEASYSGISGEVIDTMGLNNGTATGASVNTSGRYGKAGSFDGVNDYINLGNSSSLDFNGKSNITLSAWIYPKKYHASERGIIFQKQFQYYFSLDSTGHTGFYGYGTSLGGHLASTSTVSLNTWSYVTLTYNGSDLKYYINGNLDKTSSVTGNFIYGESINANVNIGGEFGQGFDMRYFNGSIDEVMIYNRSLSAEEIKSLYRAKVGIFSTGNQYILGNTNENNTVFLENFDGVDDWQIRVNQSGLTAGSIYTYSINARDLAGNSNTTETRTLSGNVAPSTISVTSSPGLTYYDTIDPSTNISIIVNVSDGENNFDTARLQWKNSTANEWTNQSMENTTEKGLYTILNGNITLPGYQDNFTYRIWMNDTIGDSSNSSLYTIQSFWDCNWTSTSDLGATAGWNQNTFIGNITILNLGDPEYNVNNCSLDFRLTYDLVEGRICFGNSCLKPSNTYTLASKANQTIIVNATFATEIKQENAVITTSEVTNTNGISSVRARNTTVSLVTNQIGPYLYQTITSYPTTVYLTTGNISLQAYVRNLMGSAVVNESNTAYNVSFNWTLPSELTNLSEPFSNFYENISDNNLNSLNLNLNFADLATTTPGIKTIYLYSYGYNSSGDLIKDANNLTIQTNAINISFLCYNATDGICVTSCGYTQDLDCPVPSTTTTSTTSGGSGGGGGGGGGAEKQEKSEALFELLNGKEEEFNLEIKNKWPYLKKNMKITVSGINSEYIFIEPSEINEIPGGSSRNIKVTIKAPKYFAKGTYILVFNVKGTMVLNNTQEEKFSENIRVTLNILDLPRTTADDYIKQYLILINEMNQSNFSLKAVEELATQINQSYNEYDFAKLESQFQQLKEIHDNAFLAQKTIEDLGKKIIQSERNGISVIESKKIFYVAETAFKRGDYKLAMERLKEAQLTYALETKGSFNLLRTITNHPIRSTGIALAALILSTGSALAFMYQRYKIRLKELNEEQKILLELMKVVQRECFEKNRMSMEEYNQAMLQYESRIASVIQERITIEAKLAHILKIKANTQSLIQEKDRLVDLIKKLQDSYMNKAEIETRVYDNMLKIYSTRLAEIEEHLTFIETKDALSSGSLFNKILRFIKLK